MMAARIPFRISGAALVLWAFLFVALGCSAQEKNEVLGEVQFIGAGKVEKTSGVWVDGQYVGYLDELTGTKKVMLLPGEHEIAAKVKLEVTPDRAAVFLDDSFVGHVKEFGGVGRKMLVSPGKHRIKIALPGYRTFETEVNLLPKQKFTIKTDLAKGSITEAGPLIKQP